MERPLVSPCPFGVNVGDIENFLFKLGNWDGMTLTSCQDQLLILT